MTYLIAGLVLFLGVHSARVFANDWRNQTLARMGEKPFKGVYSLLSLAGFVLLVWGYGQARQQGVMLWNPPTATRHIAALLTLVAFILLAATYVPGNQIKAKLQHPMVLGVKVWALAHLLANGSLADTVLFGSFLLWSVVLFAASRKRDRREHVVYSAGTARMTAVTVFAGVVAWVVFAFWLHRTLIGVSPFGAMGSPG
ncbi:MAG: NnrU family protein [Polaromonas sp.]|nr:NnrU family protein [Polaromonas sp.]